MGRLARELKLQRAIRQSNGQFMFYFGESPTRHINWGVNRTSLLPAECLNKTISNASSKIRAFQKFAENNLPHPRHHSTLTGLREVIGNDRTILCREDKLSGGKGIIIVRPNEGISDTIEYHFAVEKLSIEREARVHVFNKEAKLFQVKLLPIGNTNPIHSFENGTRYSTKFEQYLTADVVNQMTNLAVQAVEVLGLDFGAVDLVLTKREHIYLLEVNTAPGLKSQATIDCYKEILNSLRI